MAEKKAVKQAAPEEKAPKAAYVVVSEFRDRADFSKSYAINADVSHFDAERLRDLQDRKLVKKVTE